MTRPDHVAKGWGRFCAAHKIRPLFARLNQWRVRRVRGCWGWTGTVNRHGYGVLQRGRRGEGIILAQRAAWWEATGEEPVRGQIVGHTCDTPGCTKNDDAGSYEINGVAYPRRGHLFLAPQTANIQDREQKGRGGTSVLTERAVRTIRALAASGVSKTEIARRYAINRRTVHDILSGRTWGWLS